MGNFDRKNYVVDVRSVVDITDSIIKEFVKNWDYSREDAHRFYSDDAMFYHPFAEKIIQFIVEYKGGILIPDKWDTAEPLKKTFNRDEINSVVSELAKPGSCVLLRKNRKMWITLRNFSYQWSGSFICEGRNKPWILQKPTPLPRKYYSCVRFVFSEQTHPDLEFLRQLMEDLRSYLDTDYAFVWYEQNNEVLFTHNIHVLDEYEEDRFTMW